MKVMVANPPAYLWDNNRRYVQGGSRWSHSIPMPKETVPVQRARGFYPYTPYPFYLGYAASVIQDICTMKFVDGVVLNMDQDDFLRAVGDFKPDLLVIEAPTVSFHLVMKLTSIIKDQFGSKIALAGIHVSSEYLNALRDNSHIDFVLVNEFELSLRELVEKDLNANGIKGIAYRLENKPVYNGPRPILKDISSLPFPYRDSSVIFYDDFSLAGKPNIQMITSRGCPVGCNFCYTTVFYENALYRPRTPENIVAEIREVIDRFHPKQLYFDDDTITINPKHISDISKEMIKEKIDIPWTCMGDITVKRENVRIMKKAGCIGMKFGVESISPETLGRMHKGIVTADKVYKFRQMLREEGLWGHATFSLGHPGDTPESIRATMEFAKALKPNSLQVSTATPIPGTHFYEEAVGANWLATEKWNDFDGNKGSVLNFPALSNEEIDKLKEEFIREWDQLRMRLPLRARNIYMRRKELKARLTGDYPHALPD